MFKNITQKTPSVTKSIFFQNQLHYHAINGQTSQVARISYDIFSSKELSCQLGLFGHKIDQICQKANMKGCLVEEFSKQYPDVVPPNLVNTLKNDPYYPNFVASNQPFTMLTEVIVVNALPVVFNSAIDEANLLMGRPIPSNFFPYYHTGQKFSDNMIEKKLPSGNSFRTVIDTKRTTFTGLDFRVKNYFSNTNSVKPIFSNVHVTTDIDDRHVTSSHLNFYLKMQLQETKAFYEQNKNAYTAQQYAAICEAVELSKEAEREFYNTGEVGAFNKIIYNASKFLTKDDMCRILKLHNLI